MKINYTFEPKFKNPFTNAYDGVIHLVPAWSAPSLNPDGIYYCIVTCSPEYNGVYQYTYTGDDMLNQKYKIWKNGNQACMYVPLNDCTKLGELEDIKNPKVIEQVKKQQAKWWKGEVKNNPMKYTRSNGKKYKPDWMLK